MATVIKATGEKTPLLPANGTHFTLAELQGVVGGYIEVVDSRDGRLIVLDEEGKCYGKEINRLATSLYIAGMRDPIVGDVLIGTDLEINGPE